MTSVRLPTADRRIESYTLTGRYAGAAPVGPDQGWSRRAYAAAHVVVDPLAADPWSDTPIDWDRTLAYRHHLWSHGFAVAEAMDTAQRGMGLDWPHALELIRRSCTEARGVPGAMLACGVGTDQLAPGATLEQVAAAYLEQCEAVEAVGGRLIVMASRALAAAARGPDDYAAVYDRILTAAREPVILHWLGDMFDPALAGYWGSAHVDAAMATCLDVIRRHAERIDGIKISLLDASLEVSMRRKLPPGVRMYTGDDFNFPALIAGDAEGYSDALLGIFDAIAPVAAAALSAQAAGDLDHYHALLGPTEPLSRHIFRAPTRFYKTGVVFMAWLNGYQDHFTMLAGQQSARSVQHLVELFRLADAAGLIADPERAAARMSAYLTVAGAA